jgi:hypothetical protein
MGGQVHRRLGVLVELSDWVAFCRGVLHGKRWRDVLVVLIPSLIACRKLGMRPFFGLKRGFDMAKSSWYGGAVFVFPLRAPAIQSSCYLIKLDSLCGGTVQILQHGWSFTNRCPSLYYVDRVN